MDTDRDTPADTPDTNDETAGRTPGDVAENGNDAFSEAFAAFASGKPDPKDDADDEGDDDADESGAQDRGDGPPSDGDAKDGGADAPGEKPAAGDGPDPWAGASPELIAARDALLRERDEANTRATRASGRASGLQLQLNKLAGQKPQGADKPGGKSEPSDAWKALDGKIQQLKGDYPEIADVLIPLLEQQRDGLAGVEARMAPMQEADRATAEADAIREMRGIHSDFLSYGLVDNDPDYVAWLKTQPANVQQDNRDFNGWLKSKPESFTRMADSWDAREAAAVVTIFKTERAEAVKKAGGDAGKTDTKPDERRQRQLDGGKQVGSRPASAASGAPDDFDGAFAHYQRKREKTAA